jgi:ABC-2 type transport system ATP-binding protein
LAVEQFDVNAGEIVAVVGPAGSGKSLLIRLLSGELPVSGGSILIEGQAIQQARSRLGVLLEQDLLYERQSAQANLEFFCRLHGLAPQRAGEVLALVGLGDQRQERAGRLSPAAQRRLAFARLLARDTPLWLLDAPTLRADLDTQALFARLIGQAAGEGAAVVLTAEDAAWAGKFATRVVELEAGRLVPARLPGDAAEAGPPAAPARLVPYKVPARKEDRIVLYDPGELLYAASQESKTVLRTVSDEAVTNLTLQDLEGRLAGRGFFRAHRAYLVNLQHIKAVVQYTRNSYALLLDDAAETSIPLSKQSEKELQALLGY